MDRNSNATARTGRNQQELVFCHSCENEWYRSGPSGLTCPACQSDFTEIIEQDYDPRADDNLPSHPLHDHNPWATAPDPDEDDIERLGPNPGVQFRGGFFNVNPSNGGGGGNFSSQNDFPMLGPFADMMQQMLGRNAMPFQQTQAAPPGDPSSRTTSGFAYNSPFPNSFGPPTSGRVEEIPSGPHSFTFSSTRVYGNNGRTGPGEDAFPELLQGLFGSLGGNMGAGGADRGAGQAANPIAALMGLIDPVFRRGGDAVFSQEEFDRVMTQLMEQHTQSSAPGPASAAAIAALPRKKITINMLDENTGQAECSICMDNVEIGEEVTSLPCGHWFHHPCVQAWLDSHDSCPVCRAGISPKNGSRDAVRNPAEAPLHDSDPVAVARRQSGSRDYPYVVDESPTQQRRRPSGNRQSSSSSPSYSRSQSFRNNNEDDGGNGGLPWRVRSFFGGGSGNNNNNASGRRQS